MALASITPVIGTQSRILASPDGANLLAKEATLSEVLDFIGSAAQGDVLYRGSSGWARVAAGTAGHFLSTGGAGADPSWAGGVRLLASGSISGATLDLVLTSYTAYRGLLIALYNLIPATDAVNLLLRTSTNGGVSYDSGAGNYRWASQSIFATSSGVSASTGDTSIQVADNIGNSASEGADIWVEIWGQANTAIQRRVDIRAAVYAADGNTVRVCGTGRRETAADVDAVRFLMSSGNFTSGSYAIYGYA